MGIAIFIPFCSKFSIFTVFFILTEHYLRYLKFSFLFMLWFLVVLFSFLLSNHYQEWAVVVAQVVEQSLPTPEIRGSNPVIRKIYIEHLLSIVLKF